MWFKEIAQHPNPGRNELGQFLLNTQNFLAFSLEAGEFAFMWEGQPALRALANETFREDVIPTIERLIGRLPEIPQVQLNQHGLVERALRFKLLALDSIANQFESLRGQFSVREWLKRVFDAIDAILDSLIQAAGGVGGLVKEFKDALSALVKTV
jgi:hypothetical protein